MKREREAMIEIRKVYTQKFREQVVREYLYGTSGYSELVRQYGLSSGVLGKWCKRYGSRVAEDEEGAPSLRKRVMELERMVGRLTMENDLLKKFAAYTRQQTSEHSSIVTAKTLRASRRDVGSWGSPAARITTSAAAIPPKPRKMLGLKNG
jgi:transposase